MKSAIFIALCLAIATVNAYTVEDGVIVVTDSNFNEVIQEYDYVLVDFYSPSCGPCKAFAPNFAAIAQQLAISNPEIKLGKVDVTVEVRAASRYDIRWLPTLKFFIKGRSTPVHYEGAKNIQEVIDWVLKTKDEPIPIEAPSPSPSVEAVDESKVIVLSDVTFDKVIEEFDYVLVDFYSPTCGPCKAFAPNYAAMAQQLAITNPEIKFAKLDVTVETRAPAQYDIRWLPTLKFFIKGRSTPVHYEGAKNTPEIVEWLLKTKDEPIPVEVPNTNVDAAEDGVIVLTDFNFKTALNEFDFILVDFYAPWCGHCKILAPKYVEAAQQLAKTNPDIKLAKVDVTVAKELSSTFGITRLPTLKLFIKGIPTPITYGGAREIQDIIDWLLKAKADPSSVKSAEEVPTPTYVDPPANDKVIVLTDATFNETMEGFDFAFVEFYKPTCGPCRAFAANYSAIADELAETNPEIKICKVDISTETELTERFEIPRYPTFKFFIKGNSEPITYEYIRDIPNIINWLKRKAGSATVPAAPQKVIDVDL